MHIFLIPIKFKFHTGVKQGLYLLYVDFPAKIYANLKFVTKKSCSKYSVQFLSRYFTIKDKIHIFFTGNCRYGQSNTSIYYLPKMKAIGYFKRCINGVFPNPPVSHLWQKVTHFIQAVCAYKIYCTMAFSKNLVSVCTGPLISCVGECSV